MGGGALDEATVRLLAAGAAVNSVFAERAGVHVSGTLATKTGHDGPVLVTGVPASGLILTPAGT